MPHHHLPQVGSLSRLLCLPSIPIFSILFSLLSLVKAFHDLNIYPLLHTYGSRGGSSHLRLHLLLTLLPSFLCSALFRILSLSLVCIYLDIYTLFVVAPLLLVNLVVYGVMQRRPLTPSPTPASSPEEEEMVAYGWRGEVALQHQASILSTSSTPSFIQEDTSTILLNSLTGGTLTGDLITSPHPLVTTLPGLFFPSCHTHPAALDRGQGGFR